MSADGPKTQTLEEFCAENDPGPEWYVSEARKLVTPVVCGPLLPSARCKDCRTLLIWQPQRWGWRCHCKGCVDGGYDDDGQGVQERSGEGASPWEALDDLAMRSWDCEPEELLA